MRRSGMDMGEPFGMGEVGIGSTPEEAASELALALELEIYGVSGDRYSMIPPREIDPEGEGDEIWCEVSPMICQGSPRFIAEVVLF
jgi:hypothetical protein